ncbi:MAG: transcriptional regulator, TetR family [Verrucomicrobiaceae bacterium]|nr:transcriptional regulator, TetR family [Verrucomicrobiaceae bacterium]
MAERGRPRNFDRAAALQQAMNIFWQRGYEGASLCDLTAAMGINAPSLYAAFGCKEALFREAVQLYSEREGLLTARALTEQPTARQAVEALLRDNVGAFTDPKKPAGCMIVLAATNCSTANQAISDHLLERRRFITAALRRRLQRAIKEGDLPRVDVTAIANYYTTLLQGLSIQARDGASRAALNRIVDCGMATWNTLIETAKTASLIKA